MDGLLITLSLNNVTVYESLKLNTMINSQKGGGAAIEI